MATLRPSSTLIPPRCIGPGESDLIHQDKPSAARRGKRIDARTAAMAVDGWKLRSAKLKKSFRMVVLG
ncbi:hypothetical protein LX88_008415 [Lentzea californiensis]|nr:hypothetical protein [Lentzea californiensis]